jgi:hypothetical protein
MELYVSKTRFNLNEPGSTYTSQPRSYMQRYKQAQIK